MQDIKVDLQGYRAKYEKIQKQVQEKFKEMEMYSIIFDRNRYEAYNLYLQSKKKQLQEKYSLFKQSALQQIHKLKDFIKKQVQSLTLFFQFQFIDQIIKQKKPWRQFTDPNKKYILQKVRDIQTGIKVKNYQDVFNPQYPTVTAIEFLNQKLIVGGWDGTLRFDKKVLQYQGPIQSITSYSPFLLIKTPDYLHSYLAHHQSAHSFENISTYAVDRGTVGFMYTSDGEEIMKINLNVQKKNGIKKRKKEQCSRIAVKGGQLYIGTFKGVVRILNKFSFQVINQIQFSASQIVQLSFFPNHLLLYFQSEQLLIYELRTKEIVYKEWVGHANAVYWISGIGAIVGNRCEKGEIQMEQVRAIKGYKDRVYIGGVGKPQLIQYKLVEYIEAQKVEQEKPQQKKEIQ